jgi:hypothetical protein
MRRFIILVAALLVLTATGFVPSVTARAFPPADALERRAVWPQPTGGNLAADPAVPCASIWPDGDRTKASGLTDCVEYAGRRIGGADYRVFYPAEWATAPGPAAKFLPITMEAVQRAVQVYGKLGPIWSVNILFAITGIPDTLADANVIDVGGNQLCGVMVDPSSANDSEEAFRQTIAHELFHCFQIWNFSWGLDNYQNYQASKWWVEGTAEYFSNVVYPTVNSEWSRIAGFDAKSVDTPLTSMAYENTVFFQYLGNTIGNDGILKLLAALPDSGGVAEQQAALRAYPGFAQLFQDFAQAYLDKAIKDTGGQMLPVNPVVALPPPPIAESQTILLEPQPFVLYRHGLTLAAEPTFKIATEIPGGSSILAVRPLQVAGTWDKAIEANIDCGDPRVYVTAFTSLAAPTDGEVVATYTITATPDDCKPPLLETDQCLIGTWLVGDIEEPLMASYAATNAQAAAQITFQGTSGSLQYSFDGRTVWLDAADFNIQLGAEIAGYDADILIEMDGSTSAPYWTDLSGGNGRVLETPNQISVFIYVLLDGAEVFSGEATALWQLVGGSFTYTCDGDVLLLAVPGPGGPLLPPIILTRQA